MSLKILFIFSLKILLIISLAGHVFGGVEVLEGLIRNVCVKLF